MTAPDTRTTTGGSDAPVAHVSSFAPLHHRVFAFVWTGSLVSNVGTWMQTAALGYYVADRTSSAIWPALIAAAEFAPTALLAPIGGALADRMSRRALFMTGTAVQGTFAMVLAILFMGGRHPGAPVIAVYALINGSTWALAFPSFQAILPELVEPEELPAAIGLSAAQWNLGRVIGPVIGTTIYATTGDTPLWVLATNAATFLAVLLALTTVTVPPPAVVTMSIRASIAQGFRFVRGDPGLRVSVSALCLNTVLIAPFIGLIPAFVVKVLHEKSGAVGWLIFAQGLGAVVTGMSFGWLSARVGVHKLMVRAMVALPFAVAAYASTPNLVFAAVALFVVGLLYFAALTSFTTVANLRAPREYRGRVLSVNNVVLGTLYPIGIIAQGALADRLNVRSVTIGGAAIALVVYALVRVRSPGFTNAIDAPLDPRVIVAPSALDR